VLSFFEASDGEAVNMPDNMTAPIDVYARLTTRTEPSLTAREELRSNPRREIRTSGAR
jgi:hypothetical protein